jgi:hypothetical protein
VPLNAFLFGLAQPGQLAQSQHFSDNLRHNSSNGVPVRHPCLAFSNEMRIAQSSSIEEARQHIATLRDLRAAYCAFSVPHISNVPQNSRALRCCIPPDPFILRD